MPIRYVDDEPGEPISTAPRVRYLDDEPAPRTSQVLGFREGLQTVANNLEPLLSVLPYSGAQTMQRRQVSDLNRQDIEAQHDAGVEGGEAGRFAGKFAGSAPLGFIPGVGPAVAGAMMGYAGSEGDTLGDKAADTALGAVGGKVGGAIISKATDLIAPVISPAVQRLAEQGVKMTPGQIRGGAALAREDKLMSKPLVGDFIREGRQEFLGSVNIAAVNKALAPLGIKTPENLTAGHEAVAFAQDVISDAYSRIVPQLAVRADARLMAGLRNLWERGAAQLPEAQQQQFQNIIAGIRFGEGGSLAGRALQNAQSDLSRLARTYSTSASAAERELGRVLTGLKGEIDDLMIRQNPAAAPALKQTNEAWRGLSVVEDAASRADDGIASPAQLRDSARRADPSRRKRATAAGKGGPMQQFARDAREVGKVIVPNSGTADRTASALQTVLGANALMGQKAAQLYANALTSRSPALNAAIRQIGSALERPAALFGASALSNGSK